MPIIEVKNLSKKYRIRHQEHVIVGYKTLRDELTNTFKKPIYWLTGRKKTKEDFWALKDVSFDIEEGQVLGVIGPNGAGKTTLLKVLTRISPPTEGKVIIGGRVSSLLDVGTGFHPELTGRENIYLNGAILGMRKKEIEKKFDEIVEFAGVKKFLDTPAKHYSSGMYVRLAFSIAAHLEPDILLVDEILSVGDSEFQKKSLGKMKDVAQKSSRTIIFVSHNMGAVKKLCDRCVLLNKGRIKMIGEPEEVINEYLKRGVDVRERKGIIDPKKEINFREAFIINEKNEKNNQIELGKDFKIKVKYDVNEELSNSVIFVQITSVDDDKNLISSADVDTFENLLEKRERGQYEAVIEVNNILLNTNSYIVRLVAAATPGYVKYDSIDIPLEVAAGRKVSNVNLDFHFGNIIKKLTWRINKL